MNDHRLIRFSGSRFTPEHARYLHDQSRLWLYTELGRPHDGPTVVVTHHAPLGQSVHPCYATDVLNAAYASDLSKLIAQVGPPLWVHGHTHTSFDYTYERTRVICNPHGYGRENVTGFKPALVVEV